MTIDLVPLKHFSERHNQGWRIVPGYDLKAGDYAVTMQSPDHAAVESNKARASVSRNEARNMERKFPAVRNSKGRYEAGA